MVSCRSFGTKEGGGRADHKNINSSSSAHTSKIYLSYFFFPSGCDRPQIYHTLRAICLSFCIIRSTFRCEDLWVPFCLHIFKNQTNWKKCQVRRRKYIPSLMSVHRHVVRRRKYIPNLMSIKQIRSCQSVLNLIFQKLEGFHNIHICSQTSQEEKFLHFNIEVFEPDTVRVSDTVSVRLFAL